MTVLALTLAYGLHREGRPLAEIQNAVLLLTVLFQNAYVLCMRSERRPLYREPIPSNPWLLGGIALAIGLQLTAMFWPPLGGVLGTAPVDQDMLLFCLGAVGGIIVVTEITKWAVARWSREQLIAR